ncbi:MAG: PEP-CTERM sorting domain-containing protein [Bryobacteraceae bacterium]
MKVRLQFPKTLLIAGVLSTFAICSLADTISLSSSAGETTNDSASATLNIPKHPGWAAPLGSSSWVSYGETGDPSAPGYFAPANGTVVTFTDMFFISGTPGSGNVDVLADDSTSVVLNGITLFNEATSTGNGYGTCSDFGIGCLPGTEGHIDLTSGLMTGWNTLSFAVGQRAGSSYGLDYSGSVDFAADPPSATPEPASMLLFATGLLGLGGFRRWRKGQRG